MKNIKTFFIILFLPFALVSQVIDPRAQQILDDIIKLKIINPFK